MIGLCYNKTYGAMMNYDDGDNGGNEDVNDNNNATSISGSDDPIFGQITTPRSRIGGQGGDGDSSAAAAHYVSMHQTICLL